ncbi:pyrroloquinoline quinone biosynthesis peptide chaperone PqqD [Frateuria aurantia]
MLLPELEHVPAFRPGVRLHYDKVRQQWVLLAPERVVELDPIAHAILERVDAQRSLGEISEALAAEYDAPLEQVSQDIRELMADLHGKRLLRW